MKRLNRILTTLAALATLAFPSYATVLVDDVWADGSRTNDVPGPPSSTQWFADNTASLTATVGSMLGTNTTTSRQWMTHFTANAGSPVTLAVGETLRVTVVFTPTNVTAAPNTSKGLRVGLYNYADGGTRVTSDGSSQVKNSGAGVYGYFTGINFAQSFTDDTPIEFRARTTPSDINLMGSTSGIYTQVGSAGPGGSMGKAAFVTGATYTFVLSIKRNISSSELTTTITGSNGLSVSWSQTDSANVSSNYYRFDTFAIRCNTAADTADFFNFSEFKVEVIPVFSPVNGLYLNDTFADGDRTSQALPTSSHWFANESAGTSLTSSTNGMVGFPTSSSRVWLTYFTDLATNPVDLAVGETLKATLVFTPTNVPASGGSSTRGLRIGLYDFAEGGTRATTDESFVGSSTGSGTNVVGYMLNQSFYGTFPVDGPIEFRARTNAVDGNAGNLMGTTSTYLTVGGTGPAGQMNMPGFVSGTPYTFELTVKRTAGSSVDIGAKITGGSLNLSHTVTDTIQAYHRFDCLAIRAENANDTAAALRFTNVKVEVLSATPTFRITAIERPSATQVKLTWDSTAGKTYQVQSRSNVASGTWTTNFTTNASGSPTAFTDPSLSGVNQRYYRVVQLP